MARAASSPAFDALTDAHALLFCNGRNDGDNSTPENSTGIDALFGEAPVIDAVGREAVEMLEGFEYAFAGEPVKRPKQKPIELALPGSSTVRWRGRVRCARQAQREGVRDELWDYSRSYSERDW